MKRMLCFGTLMMVILLAAPHAAQSQNKDKSDSSNVTKATPQDYENLRKLRELTGIVASADARSITLRLENARVVPNVRKKSGRAYPKLVREYKEYELNVAEKVVVHQKFFIVDYDDKGNLKANEVQKKELSKKGFIAVTVNDIKSGNVATLVLAPGKKEEKVEGVGNVSKPQVTKITLLKEGAPVEPAKTPEKKKKN